MSSGGFPTPLLRPAADPPSPPEFHLTPAALDLPALSNAPEPRLTHSGSAYSSFCSSSLPSSPPHEEQRQDLLERRQDMKQQDHVEDEEAEMETGAWRVKSPGSLLTFGAGAVGAAPEAATTAGRGNGEMSTSVLTGSRGRSSLTRARSCSWARGSASPARNRNVPMRASSSILLSSGHSQHYAHPYRGDAHHLHLLSSRKGIATHTRPSVSSVFELRSTTSAAIGEESGVVASASAAASAPAGHASATATASGGPLAETEAAEEREEDMGSQGREGPEQEVESINLPTVKAPTGPLLLGSDMREGEDTKAAAEGPGDTAATGSKATLLPLSCEAASKLLVDAQSPSSRGSVSSMLTCSTRSSASGSGAPDDQERAALLSMMQQQHTRQEQHPRQQQQLGQPPFVQQEEQNLLGKEVVSRTADGTRVAASSAPERGLSLAENSTSVASTGGATAVQGVVALEGSKEGGEARRGGRMRGAVGEAEEAGVVQLSRLLHHPFIGLSPAAQRGLPEEGEGAGIFERIWADVLRREAAQQQAAVPMLETAGMTPASGGESHLLSTAPREEQDEQHEQQDRQQQQTERQLGSGALQQQQQQQQGMLLRAGAEQQR